MADHEQQVPALTGCIRCGYNGLALAAERDAAEREVERLREALGQAQMLYHHAARHPADVSTACDWRECRKLLTAAQPTEGQERCPTCGVGHPMQDGLSGNCRDRYHGLAAQPTEGQERE